MEIKRPGKGDPRRYTQAELVELLGASRNAISEWAKKDGFPKAVKGKYCGLDVIVWYLVEHSKQLVEKGQDQQKPAGSESPEDERYRRIRADREEIRLHHDLRRVVDREVIRTALGEFASEMRETSKILERECGTSAKEILDDGLVVAGLKIAKVIGVPGDPLQEPDGMGGASLVSDSMPPEHAPDDASVR